MAAFEQAILAREHVTGVSSILSVLRQLQRAESGGEELALPANERDTAYAFDLLEAAARAGPDPQADRAGLHAARASTCGSARWEPRSPQPLADAILADAPAALRRGLRRLRHRRLLPRGAGLEPAGRGAAAQLRSGAGAGGGRDRRAVPLAAPDLHRADPEPDADRLDRRADGRLRDRSLDRHGDDRVGRDRSDRGRYDPLHDPLHARVPRRPGARRSAAPRARSARAARQQPGAGAGLLGGLLRELQADHLLLAALGHHHAQRAALRPAGHARPA